MTGSEPYPSRKIEGELSQQGFAKKLRVSLGTWARALVCGLERKRIQGDLPLDHDVAIDGLR
jgi:hypothetical protein